MKKLVSLLLIAAMMVTAAFALTSCGKVKIGVQAGTTGQYYVDGDADWGFDGLAGYQSVGFNNGGLAVQDLKNGGVKYVIIDQAPALQLQQSVSDIKVIDIPLTVEEYAYGVDKNQPELLASINQILANKSAEINAIIAKYATGTGITPIASATQDDSKADQQLVIATNASFAPFEYVDGDKFAGIDIEIMKLVADELGMELVIKDMDFEAVVTSVGKNGVDVAAAGLTVNEKRKESVNFTTSYYNAAQVLITLSGDTTFDACKTADDVVAALKNAL